MAHHPLPRRTMNVCLLPSSDPRDPTKGAFVGFNHSLTSLAKDGQHRPIRLLKPHATARD